MATAERELKRDRLNLRARSRQMEVIREAAKVAHKDISAFVLDAAMVSAQLVLERKVLLLDTERWDRFIEVLDRPVTPLAEKPRLEKLLRQPNVLDR